MESVLTGATLQARHKGSDLVTNGHVLSTTTRSISALAKDCVHCSDQPVVTAANRSSRARIHLLSVHISCISLNFSNTSKVPAGSPVQQRINCVVKQPPLHLRSLCDDE